jgi:hypothetical protein
MAFHARFQNERTARASAKVLLAARPTRTHPRQCPHQLPFAPRFEAERLRVTMIPLEAKGDGTFPRKPNPFELSGNL